MNLLKPLSHRTFYAVLVFAVFQTSNLFGQAVSINASGTAPDAQSILDISSTTKGVLLPRMTSSQRAAIAPTAGSDNGMTVYDITTESYWYWDGTANTWREIPNTAGIVTTLDGAYDGGGSGVGRIITADAGAVNIQGTGGLLVNGITGIGTSTPDANYALSVLKNTNNSVKIAGANIGLLVEMNAGSEDGISSIQTSTSNTSAYFAVRGEVTNESGVGYLGYHTTGDNSYGVYGQSGTYAGYFDGHVNFTGELRLNGSAGTAGQVLVSQGSGTDPIWGAAGVQSVTAGAALVNSGTATAPILDVAADNGLNVDVAADKIQLGGALTEATTITHGANNLIFNLSGTGEFIVQDGGVDHFKVDAAGDAFFGSDTYFNDTNTGGTTLAKVSDAGTGGDDGRLEIFANGLVSHTIHGDGNTEFNQQAFDRDFIVRSTGSSSMFYLDAGTNRVGLGTATPSRELHVVGDARITGLADANSAVVISNNTGNLNKVSFTGSTSDVLLGNGTFGPGSAFNDNDWLKVITSASPSAVTDWIYTSGRVGVNFGTAANPYAALHVKAQAYMGDDNTANFFNSNAILHLAKTDNPHLLLEDVGNNRGGFSLDAGGLNVATENGDIDFRTGVTFNGDFSNTGVSRVIIENGGEVGIGTLTPDRDLHVSAPNGAQLIVTRNDLSTNAGETLGDIQFDSEDDSGPSNTGASAIIRGIAAEDHGNSNKGGHLAFLTQQIGSSNIAAERMRITSAGNVAIGATTASVKLYVAGDATITGKFNSNGIEETSDQRFKKNIVPLKGALDKVMQLQGVTYNWRADEFPKREFGSRTEIGVIAQDIEKVYPELVSTDVEGYKSVQYSHMVPVLLEAIKEQQALIEHLNRRLDDSASQYSELQSKFEAFSVELGTMNSRQLSEEQKEVNQKGLETKKKELGTK